MESKSTLLEPLLRLGAEADARVEVGDSLSELEIARWLLHARDRFGSNVDVVLRTATR